MKGTVMQSLREYARSGLALLVVALGLLTPGGAARSEEPVYATVAILLPPSDPAAFETPVAVLFGGPPGTDGDDSLVIEGGSQWGEFSGADLTDIRASYVTRGGIGGDVRLIDGPADARGVMHLGPQSDTTLVLVAFYYIDGSVLRWEPDPTAATGMIVILTGRVR
jgi:hypothetical protein